MPWSPAPIASSSSSDIRFSFASRALSTPMAISADCWSNATITAQVFPSNPIAPSVYPISFTVSRTICGISISAFVVISPVTSTNPVHDAVSHATRLIGSCSINASKIASDIASHTLSGCPSVTDSEVNNLFSMFHPPVLSIYCTLPLAHKGQAHFNYPAPHLWGLDTLRAEPLSRHISFSPQYPRFAGASPAIIAFIL